MDICEKISYIKGLAEGLSLDETTKEGKILTAIIDLLGDITEEICDIEDGCDELMEQIDAVDEDLADLENFIYEDDEDDDDCDCDCDDCDCDCDDAVYEINYLSANNQISRDNLYIIKVLTQKIATPKGGEIKGGGKIHDMKQLCLT